MLTVRECLQLQLSEVEMLQGMYSPDEFIMHSSATRDLISSLLHENHPVAELDDSDELDFIVKLKIDCDYDSDLSSSLQVYIQLPHQYPNIPPKVILRPEGMHKDGASALHKAVDSGFHGMEMCSSHSDGPQFTEWRPGELVVVNLLLWLQDNTLKFYSPKAMTHNTSRVSNEFSSEESCYSRLWIYSHHIYSSKKRKDILQWAKELQLHGFCKPGKPGIICVEGLSSQVDEFWTRIRRLNWQRLTLKERENFTTSTGCLKFSSFEEKLFGSNAEKQNDDHNRACSDDDEDDKKKPPSKHTPKTEQRCSTAGSVLDLGDLHRWLDDLQLAWVFPLFFGVEGRRKTKV